MAPPRADVNRVLRKLAWWFLAGVALGIAMDIRFKSGFSVYAIVMALVFGGLFATCGMKWLSIDAKRAANKVWGNYGGMGPFLEFHKSAMKEAYPDTWFWHYFFGAMDAETIRNWGLFLDDYEANCVRIRPRK